MQVESQSFNVSSGIIVSAKQEGIQPSVPKSKEKRVTSTLDTLFFSQSDLVKEILGSISGFILNPFSNQALEQSFSRVYKPIAGTIDLIARQSKQPKGHVIYANVFRVIKIIEHKKVSLIKMAKMKQTDGKKSSHSDIGITNKDLLTMEKVIENNQTGEILYLNRNNALGITKTDIVQLSSLLGKRLHFDDAADRTCKFDKGYSLQTSRIRCILDYYIKNSREANAGYHEEMCEFFILQPLRKNSLKKMKDEVIIREDIVSDLEFQNTHDDVMSSNCQELSENDADTDEQDESSSNKQIPLKMRYHASSREFTANHTQGLFPVFIIKDTPFKQERNPTIEDQDSYSSDISIQNHFEQDEFTHPFKQINEHTHQDSQAIGTKQLQEEQEQCRQQNQKLDKKNLYNQRESSLGIKEGVDDSDSIPLTKVSSIKQQPSKEQEDDDEMSEDLVEDKDKGITKVKDPTVYFSGSLSDLNHLINNFTRIHATDEQRIPDAHYKGGKQCLDKTIIDTTRSVGKYIIGQIGRKIISGDFNLTQVSFPIKAMIPVSALQTAQLNSCLFPVYMGVAANIMANPVERMKLVITAAFANFPVANTFTKPLNPILGETFEGAYIDGTKLYAEQISHHPPVSYFLVEGPGQSYKYYGYFVHEAKAGWNSLTLKNQGKRTLIFSDGQRIDFNFSGSFLGTLKQETLGSVTFEDAKNRIKAIITSGKVKKKPSDYISGDILVNGQAVSKCYGSYLGFIEFDGIRYWDYRHVLPMKITVIDSKLKSDHLKRTDRKLLVRGQVKKAQEEKERLEMIQRADALARKKYAKSRVKKE